MKKNPELDKSFEKFGHLKVSMILIPNILTITRWMIRRWDQNVDNSSQSQSEYIRHGDPVILTHQVFFFDRT